MAEVSREFVFTDAGSRRSVLMSEKWPVCRPERTLRADGEEDRFGR